LALLTGCGVHLGQDDLPVAEARRLLGPAALVGATCRSLAEVERAAREGADHVGVGPIFPSLTKPLPHPPLLPEGLRSIALESPLALVAISGITLENIGQVARAGAHAAAVGQGLFAAPDVENRARLMLNEWSR